MVFMTFDWYGHLKRMRARSGELLAIHWLGMRFNENSVLERVLN
jgi:uncharacterized protein (DUF486 family)